MRLRCANSISIFFRSRREVRPSPELKTMARCIQNVFALIQPERQELPTVDELSDATINIQSFVFNSYGAIDNLAWIWVSEKGQKRGDGTPILDNHLATFRRKIREAECWGRIGALAIFCKPGRI
jgi:hypothetical protein